MAVNNIGTLCHFENTVKGTLNGLCFIIWSSQKCNRLDCHESYIFLIIVFIRVGYSDTGCII